MDGIVDGSGINDDGFDGNDVDSSVCKYQVAGDDCC